MTNETNTPPKGPQPSTVYTYDRLIGLGYHDSDIIRLCSEGVLTVLRTGGQFDPSYRLMQPHLPEPSDEQKAYILTREMISGYRVRQAGQCVDQLLYQLGQLTVRELCQLYRELNDRARKPGVGAHDRVLYEGIAALVRKQEETA